MKQFNKNIIITLVMLVAIFISGCDIVENMEEDNNIENSTPTTNSGYAACTYDYNDNAGHKAGTSGCGNLDSAENCSVTCTIAYKTTENCTYHPADQCQDLGY